MKLLKENELRRLMEDFPLNVSLGNHGYYHKDCTSLSQPEWEDLVNHGEEHLSGFSSKIPFFAYPCDLHNADTDKYLISRSLIPVYCDGNVNYNNSSVIHRELL